MRPTCGGCNTCVQCCGRIITLTEPGVDLHSVCSKSPYFQRRHVCVQYTSGEVLAPKIGCLGTTLIWVMCGNSGC